MFAMRREGQVTDQDEIVVTLDILENAGKNLAWIFIIAGEELFKRLYDPFWRIQQTFARRVIARPAKQDPDSSFRLLTCGADRNGVSGFGQWAFKQGLNHVIHVVPPSYRISVRGAGS
jgi:hypothetical protein